MYIHVYLGRGPSHQRRLRTIKIHVPCIAGHTEHAHHIHLAYKFIHRLCGDMLTQRVEVGCMGVVQFLWRTCVFNDRAQPPLPSHKPCIVLFKKLYLSAHTCNLIQSGRRAPGFRYAGGNTAFHTVNSILSKFRMSH